MFAMHEPPQLKPVFRQFVTCTTNDAELPSATPSAPMHPLCAFLSSPYAHHAVTVFVLTEAVISAPSIAADSCFATLDILSHIVVCDGLALRAPKTSALLLAACLSIAWKLVSRDASPRHVANGWNSLGLHGGVRLDTSEIVEQEAEILTLRKFQVAQPKWWTFTVQFAAAHFISGLRSSTNAVHQRGFRDITNTSRLVAKTPQSRGHLNGESPVFRNGDEHAMSESRRLLQTHYELLATNLQSVLLEYAICAAPRRLDGEVVVDRSGSVFTLDGALRTVLAMSGVVPIEVSQITFSLPL